MEERTAELCRVYKRGEFQGRSTNRDNPRDRDISRHKRHTFAVHRLLAWYRDGQDVNARLPWLATYMGHVSIHSTQVYLRPTAELMEQVDRRFYQHYQQYVQSPGDPS